jgi:bifunctional non-homologous end joining protein LigD
VSALGRPPAERVEIEVDGRRLALTHLSKPLWPDPAFTKGDLLAYVRAAAPVLLPHLAGRPLTLGRYPDGVDGPGWFQSNCPPGKPEWLPVAAVPLRARRAHSPSPRTGGESGERALRYCVVNDLAALLWVANAGAIELHPFLARADDPERPLALVVDLDPAPPAGLADCALAALAAREALAAAGLAPLAKTSGMHGLHLYAAVAGTSLATFAETKALARELGRELAARHPALFTDRARRAARAGRVYLDWRQNDANLSTVAPYSLRAGPRPLASTPVTWDEVEDAAERRDAAALRFGPAEVLARVVERGDLFAQVAGPGPGGPLG